VAGSSAPPLEGWPVKRGTSIVAVLISGDLLSRLAFGFHTAYEGADTAFWVGAVGAGLAIALTLFVLHEHGGGGHRGV
jgi:hypothetical protein